MQIKELFLNRKSLTDEAIIKAINKNQDVESIRIYCTNCTGNILFEIAKCGNLKSVDIGIPKLRSSDLNHIRNLQNLNELSLYLPKEEALYPTGKFENLKKLSVYTDCVDSSVLSNWLDSFEYIEDLEVIVDNKPNNTTAFQRKPGSFANLKRLNLAGLGITDEFLETIAKGSPLQDLSLSNTSCTDKGLEVLSNCSSLNSLSVCSHDNIGCHGLACLTTVPIKSITISCEKRPIDLTVLKGFVNLNELQLWDYRTGNCNILELLKSISQLPKLRKLLILSEELSHEHVAVLKEMKQLRYLHCKIHSLDDQNELRVALPDCKISSFLEGE